MAAAYLFHIAENQAFFDGNKRTAFLSAHVFLYMNGVLLETSQDQAANLMQEVAAGRATKAVVTEFLREYGKPSEIPFLT